MVFVRIVEPIAYLKYACMSSEEVVMGVLTHGDITVTVKSKEASFPVMPE